MRTTTTTILSGLLLLAAHAGIAQSPAAITPPTTTIMAAATVGQTVTIGSTPFVVSATKQLAQGVEFYTMKPTTKNGKGATFLRSNNAYNTTVFTQAQYEAFLKTGKLSSFGTLVKKVVGGSSVTYVAKGTSKAMFGSRNGELAIYEFVGDIPTAMALANNGEHSPAREKCNADCDADYDQCKKDIGDTDNECNFDRFFCYGICSMTTPRQAMQASIHALKPLVATSYK